MRMHTFFINLLIVAMLSWATFNILIAAGCVGSANSPPKHNVPIKAAAEQCPMHKNVAEGNCNKSCKWYKKACKDCHNN